MAAPTPSAAKPKRNGIILADLLDIFNFLFFHFVDLSVRIREEIWSHFTPKSIHMIYSACRPIIDI